MGNKLALAFFMAATLTPACLLGQIAQHSVARMRAQAAARMKDADAATAPAPAHRVAIKAAPVSDVAMTNTIAAAGE